MPILGSHPVQAIMINNHTIAASKAGTAAATILGTVSNTQGACAWQVYNLSLRNLELILGAEYGATATVIFVPGNTTVSGAHAGMAQRAPVTLCQGMVIRARTTEDTPITCAETTPLVLTLWE